MVAGIEEILNDLSWNEGFRIPIANAENKRLEEEIERKSHLRISLKSELENTRERIDEIRRHALDVRQQHNQNQRLLGAHSTQVETENQLYRNALFDESKFNQEIRQKEHCSKATAEKIGNLQLHVNRLMKRLDASKKAIKMDKDKLLAWEDSLNKTEEKNMIIEEFVKSDEKTFKRIELERQNLSEKAELYRQSVVTAVGDINELELTLQRTACLYGQEVKARRQLMDQWAQSVHVLTQRDNAIYSALQDMNELREIAKSKMDAYHEAQRFFKIQQNENKELEDLTRSMEREYTVLKEERRKLQSSIDSYAIEVHYRRKQLQEMGRRTDDLRSNIKRKKQENENKKEKIKDVKQRIAELTETLKTVNGQKLNVEERKMQMQDMLEKEEKRKMAITKETNRQQGLIMKATQRVNELEGERKVMVLRQQAEAKRLEQLDVQIAKDKKLVQLRKEDAYNADVELQRCEMKLQHILGQERDRDELEAKTNRLRQMQASLKDRHDTLKTVQNQLAQVENEIRKLGNSISDGAEELKRLKEKQQELCVLLDGGQKQLKAAKSNYEEKKVEQNILELRVNEASKIIFRVDDKLYDLEKYALQMEAAAMERKAEIKVQKETLTVQKRLLQAECHEIKNAISENKARTRQCQARYELGIAALGTNPEDGKPMTSSILKIQSAQERYLLQERGDDLDRTIRKSEHEIRSMENTLRLVNVCNDKFKSSLSIVDENSPEKIEQRKLDEEMCRALENVRRKQQKLDDATEDVTRMQNNCKQTEKDIERVTEDKKIKEEIVAVLEQQITEQREKLQRADRNLRRVMKDIQNLCACTTNQTILVQERDIAVRELQELNLSALQRIAEFMIRHVEAEAYVKKHLEECNINLPSTVYLKQQSSQSSSRCESQISFSSKTTKSSARESAICYTFRSHFDTELLDNESIKSDKSSSKQTPKRITKRKAFTLSGGP